MAALAARLETLRRAVADAERRAAERDTASTLRAYEYIVALTVDGFWRLPDAEINRWLHPLFSSRRMVYFEGKIDHTTDAAGRGRA